jgi:hypothetical protein
LLNLSRTKLTDACAARLMPTAFYGICLNETGLTDAGLRAFADDEGGMSELYVRGTRVTANGIVDFKEMDGRSRRLYHDFPEDEINALYSARFDSRAAKAEAATNSDNPE